METFLATLAATAFIALGIVAYRHPSSYIPIGQWLLSLAVFGTVYLAATVNGVYMGMQMAAGQGAVERTAFTIFGYHPYTVVFLGFLLVVYLLILVRLGDIIKLPKDGTDH